MLGDDSPRYTWDQRLYVVSEPWETHSPMLKARFLHLTNFGSSRGSNPRPIDYQANVLPLSHGSLCFTNKFGANIKLQGEWGVALRTIGYQKTWLNVTKREGVRITIAVHVVRENSRKIHEITRQVPEGSYASPTAFITMLYSITKTLYTTSGLAGEDNVRVVYALEDVLDIAYQQETNQFTFEIITNTFKQIEITIEGGVAGLQLRKVVEGSQPP